MGVQHLLTVRDGDHPPTSFPRGLQNLNGLARRQRQARLTLQTGRSVQRRRSNGPLRSCLEIQQRQENRKRR